MLRRGAHGIIGIGRVFRIMDDNRSGTLDLAEFAKGCAESGLDISDVDIRTLFKSFDRNGDGTISYEEFLRVIKGPLPPCRLGLVEAAYKILDKDGNGQVDFNDICDTYSAKKHPAVLEGRKTERQVLEEFLSTFELALSDKPDGVVTPEEFVEYYSAVSASIDNDDYFAQMMNSSWNIDGHAAQYKTYEKGWTNDEAKPARPSSKGGPGVYKGFEKNPTGKATMFSGVQSAQNPFNNMTSYYEGKDQPLRKSLAAQHPRPSKEYTKAETPGQQSNSNSMNVPDREKVYNSYLQTKKGAESFPQPSNAASVNAQHSLEIRRFKERLASRGAKGLIGLKKQFKLADADGSGAISLSEFQTILDDYKIPGVSASDAQRLFNVFDRNKNGVICFDEFLTALCGEFNETRRRLVREAFQKLDTNGNGILEISEVKHKFDPSRHPDVKANLKTVEEVRFGFFDLFTTFHNAATNFSGETGITLDQFLEYHHFLTEQFERDIEFKNFIVGVWNMDLVPVGKQEFAGKHTNIYGKNSREQWKFENHKGLFGNKDSSILSHQTTEKVQERQKVDQFMPTAGGKKTLDFVANNGVNVQGEYKSKRQEMNNSGKLSGPTEQELLLRVRERIRSRGARGILSLGKSFKVMDDNNNGTLDDAEFAKALRSYRISSDPLEIKAIFETFDPDRNGVIDYKEFLRGIVGDMNQRREALVKRAFQVMDRDGSGVLDISDLKGRYNAKKHPDVMAGKQTEDDILFEFLDTFEQAYAMKHGNQMTRDRSVTLDEWIEYYQNVSASIDNDDYFELMMNNTWNLDGKAAPKRAWAGDL